MENFRHYVSVEICLKGLDRRYHSFEANDYHSLVSLNAFFYGLKNRNHNLKIDKIFVVHRNYGKLNEWVKYLATEARGVRLFPRIPIVITDHKSLWNFYKAIGYDHKKNRWNQYD